MKKASTFCFLFECLLLLQCMALHASTEDQQTLSVYAHVKFESIEVKDESPAHRNVSDVNLHTVIWLEPEGESPDARPKVNAGTYTMMQQNKEFVPHFLVIPVGSVVSFPNRDPFFHNVFSLFNGKRFDLGLYQSGQVRAVTFNRVGVSYIFCNIHPEMAAVIITLDTPYYALPNSRGDLVFQGVKEGNYRLHVWSENTPQEKLGSLERAVSISAGHTRLEDITIPMSRNALEDHLNKFGVPYDTHNNPY